MFQPVAYPDHIEPLVRFVEDTAPERIIAATHDKLQAGTPVKDMLLASALAVIRSSDLPPGHHGGPLHPLSGIHAVHHTAARLSGEYAMLPVIQHVALSNKHIQSPVAAPYILAEAKPLSTNDSVEATLDTMAYHVGRGEYAACDHYFLYLMQQLSPMQVLEQLLRVAIPKNSRDDHYFLFPVFTWRALEYFGWDYMRYIGRGPVRYVTRPPAPPSMAEVDALIEEHGLLKRELRYDTGEDETPAIVALRDEIGRCNLFSEIPAMLAHALADGLSVQGTAEALSVGGATLFLRSESGNPMDVHIHTGANTRRYLLQQPEISLQTKLRALFMWNTGPEVLIAQRKMSPDILPDPDRVEALPFHTQDELLDEIEELITSLPVGERLPKVSIATWQRGDEVKQAAVLAQQYANYEYDPEALILLLGKIACRDNFTEMHAFKHHQATYEEFHTTRPSLRWRHLVAAVQAAAVSHGRIQDVYEHAAEVLHV